MNFGSFESLVKRAAEATNSTSRATTASASSAAALTKARNTLYKKLRKEKIIAWENNIEYFFAAVVAFFILGYIIEEIRIRLNRGSKKPFPVYQYVRNIVNRIALFSIKIPLIGCRIYLPLLFFGLATTGFLTAAMIAQTPDKTFKHQYDLTTIAKRSGHVGVACYPMLFVLAMKNSPIGLLMGSSHEKLNIVHRLTGRLVVAFLGTHLITYTISYARTGTLHKLTEASNLYGIFGFVALLLIAITSIGMARRRAYELFYMLHWTFTIVVLTLSWLHERDCEIYVKASACIIGIDLGLRLLRTWTSSPSLTYFQKASVAVVDEDLVAVTINRPKFGPMSTWVPGAHAFLNIPSMGIHQRHPFTIASIPSDGVIKFVVKRQKGFTSVLHRSNGPKVLCSIDGPYGSLKTTRFSKYPHVLLIGGGVGITFILPVLQSLLHAEKNQVESVTVLWSARTASMHDYFRQQLNLIQENHKASESGIELVIKIAFTGTRSSTSSLSNGVTRDTQVIEKIVSGSQEKQTNLSVQEISTKPGRVVVTDVLAEALEGRERLAVGACGPSHLLLDARRAVSKELANSSRDILLYTEEFEW